MFIIFRKSKFLLNLVTSKIIVIPVASIQRIINLVHDKIEFLLTLKSEIR